ncbi:MAG TPA: hypothetical protein VMD92_06845 [Acidobacteriaceae bacterium]|nr:hypothetical protein [Acidobacteriaceae bacterium]
MTSGMRTMFRVALLAAAVVGALSADTSSDTPAQSQAEINKERAEAAKVQTLVDRFAPEGWPKPSANTALHECSAVYARTPAGEPATIFAVYLDTEDADHADGGFRVIERDREGNYSARNLSLQSLNLDALYCSADVETVDRSGTKVLEISVSDINPDVAPASLLVWNGSELNDIAGDGLIDVDFVNLFGDGTMALVSVEEVSREEDAPVPVSIYRLRHGRYVFAENAVDSLSFICGARCVVQTYPFTVGDDSRGPYVLQLGNGDLDGGSRVHAAQIWINGKEIAGVAKLNERVGALTLPIPELHPGSNTISGTLARAPGVRVGKLNYAILDHPLPQ